MRSIPLKAAAIVILATAWACSDNGGGGTGPGAPTAAFSAPTNCTAGAACQFTDASTPAAEITAWSWTFGDDPNAAPTTDKNPTHTYAAAGNYIVTLTVTSPNGTSSPATQTVAVAAPANPAPTASFSVPSCGVNIDCTFTSTSSDAGPPVGTIVTTHWNFGDAGSATNEADGLTVTHRYTTGGDKTVTLTVTDDGGATGTTSQTVSVQAAPASDCPPAPGSATNALCTLQLSATQKSQVTITMTSRNCELVGNRVTVQQPTRQSVFDNICTRDVPPVYTVKDVNGATATFLEGAQLPIQFTRGDPRAGDPPAGPPVARVRGTFPDWTITIDDGGNPQGQNEPDFNDVILAVHATVVP
jgi:PKD repeat protein